MDKFYERFEGFWYLLVIIVIVTVFGTGLLAVITGNFWASLALSAFIGVLIAQSTIIID